MTRTGVIRAFGATLRRILNRALSNRFSALGTGLGVTVLLQSSTATCLMTVSFASQGYLATSSAFAVMLGADIGTTIVAQIFTVRMEWLSPLLIAGGYATFLIAGRKRIRDIGRLFIGLGLLILALRLILIVSEPIKSSEALLPLLSALAKEPLLAILLAGILAWLAHSSLATILLIASLAPALPPGLLLPLVLGANLGGTLPAVAATWRAPMVARRVAAGNACFKALGCLVALAIADPLERWLFAFDPDPTRFVVNLHVAFNIALAAVFLPAIGWIARLSERLMPDSPTTEDEATPRYLHLGDTDEPVIALTNATRETLRMIDVLGEMLRMSLQALERNDSELCRDVSRKDNTIDSLYGAIKLFLVDLSREPLGGDESRRCNDVMSFVTNLEHVGDILDKNVMELAAKKIKHRLSFSDQGMAEIRELHGRVEENLRLASNVFVSGNTDLARKLLAEKDAFRDLERAAAESHHERLRTGLRDSLETSALHLDILRDLKRINSHLCSAAYPILEKSGDLRRSRLQSAD